MHSNNKLPQFIHNIVAKKCTTFRNANDNYFRNESRLVWMTQ